LFRAYKYTSEEIPWLEEKWDLSFKGRWDISYFGKDF
jgi:hypothetical protein